MSSSAGSVTRLLRRFLGRRASGFLAISVGLVGGVLGFIAAPELENDSAHAGYEPFFSAAAQVAAGIFIVLAVQARYVTSNPVLAVTTVLFVGAAAVGAVVGLLPDASQCVYDVAFAAVTGGGLAALLSTAILAVATLSEARLARRQEVIDGLHRLADELANEQIEQPEKDAEPSD